MDLEWNLHILRKHLRLIVLGPVLAALVALVVTSLQVRSYTAESSLAILKGGAQVNLEPKIISLSDLNTASIDLTARRKALATIGKSPTIASAVIAKLGDQLSISEHNATTLLESVDVVVDGELVKIQVKSDNPERAALIANAWAQEYEDRVNDIYGENPLSAADVQAQANASKAEYEKKQAALLEFLSDNRLESLKRQIVQQQQQLTDLLVMSARLDHLLSDARALDDRLSKSASPTSADELALLLLEANAFSVSANLPVQTDTASNSPNAVSSNSAPFNLQFRVDQLTSVDKSELSSSVGAIISTIEARRQTIQSQSIREQQQALNRLQADFERENGTRQDLTRSRDLALTAYTTLLNKANEVNISAQSKSSVVRIALPALAPEAPNGSNRLVSSFLAAMLGLLLSLGIVFGSEYTADLASGTQAVENLLSLPVIGTIPEISSTHASGQKSLNGNSTVLQLGDATVQSFHLLRQHLLKIKPSVRVIMVVSALPDDGKSLVAANLAKSFAQLRKTVVLVDADFRQPAQHEIFNVPNDEGLGALLTGVAPNGATPLPPSAGAGVLVMPTGKAVDDPSVLLASPAFEHYIEHLRAITDVIVIDAPAVLGLADSVLIAGLADAILFVVQSDGVARRDLLRAKEILSGTGVPIAGVVLIDERKMASRGAKHASTT